MVAVLNNPEELAVLLYEADTGRIIEGEEQAPYFFLPEWLKDDYIEQATNLLKVVRVAIKPAEEGA